MLNPYNNIFLAATFCCWSYKNEGMNGSTSLLRFLRIVLFANWINCEQYLLTINKTGRPYLWLWYSFSSAFVLFICEAGLWTSKTESICNWALVEIVAGIPFIFSIQQKNTTTQTKCTIQPTFQSWSYTNHFSTIILRHVAYMVPIFLL